MPGLTLSFNKLADSKQRSSLYSFLDSIMSVAIFEQVDLTRVVEEVVGGGESGAGTKTREIEYFAKPFEPFCKENLSFLTKLLFATKFSTGLDFSLKNFGVLEDRILGKYVHATEYKSVSVRATRSQVVFNVKYTL